MPSQMPSRARVPQARRRRARAYRWPPHAFAAAARAALLAPLVAWSMGRIGRCIHLKELRWRERRRLGRRQEHRT